MNFGKRFFLIMVFGILLPQVVLSAPSPWDSWRSGYTNFEHGEMLRERGSYTQALKSFERARKNYLAVRSARPDWNQRVIADRIRDCDRQIAELRRLLNENKSAAPSGRPSGTPAVPARQKESAAAKPVKSEASSVPADSSTGTSSDTSTGTSYDTSELSVIAINVSELAGLKQQIIELKLRNEKITRELQTQRKFENEIASLLRDRKIAGDRYALLEKRYQALEEEAKKPGDRLAELEQQLLNERLSVERLEKRLTGAEQQLKIEKENSRMNQAAKNSLENLLKQRNEELLRSSQEIAAGNEKLKIIDDLREKISALNSRISDLQRENSTLTGNIRQLNEQNRQLSDKNREIADKNSELSGKSSDFATEKRQLSSEISELNSKNRDLERRNSELNEKISLLTGQLKSENEKTQQISDKNRDLTESNKQFSDKNRQLSEINRQLDEKNQEISKENRQLNRSKAELSEKVAKLTDQLSSRDEEISGLRKNARELALSSSSSMSDKDKELAALRDRILLLNRQIANLESQNSSQKRQAEARDKQFATQTDTLNEVQKKLAAVKKELNEKNIQFSELEKRSDEYKRSLDGQEKQLTSDAGEIAGLKKQLEELKKQLAEREKQFAEQKKQLDSRQNQQTLQASAIAEEKGRSALLEQQLQNSRKELELVKAQLTDSGKSLKEVGKRADELRKERDIVGNELSLTQQKINVLNAEKRSLQLSLEQERNSGKLNAAELAGLRDRNRTLEEDVKVLYQRNSELEKRLATRNSADFQAAAAARNSVKKLENDLLVAQNQLVSLRKELDSGSNAGKELERKLKAVNDENLKARAQVVAAAEREKQLQQELTILRPMKAQHEQLQRDFKALAAENRENRLLVEAAKPRQAELEKAKLRLVENDRLKTALAREQQLNAELKEAYNKDQQELTSLRKRASEFDAVRRKVVELEARAKEADRLRNVEKELTGLRERETELTALKIRFSEVETSLRNTDAALKNLEAERKRLAGELSSLQEKNHELQKIRRTNNELEAIISSQNSELDKLNRQLTAASSRNSADLHAACRMEADKLRVVAASVGPLNDQIHRLQSEVQNLKNSYEKLLIRHQQEQNRIKLKDSEISRLQRLNRELADIRKKSADDLLEKVDASRISRLEDELSSLNKLNAELAAERDKLAARLENRDDGSSQKTVQALQSDRSPEDLAGAGFIAEKDGKTELAIWHYRQALANNPEFIPAHLRLGGLFYRRGSFAEAASHLQKALSADPDNRRLAIDTARCYIALSRFGNAKTIIDRRMQLEPENALIVMCSALIDAGCGATAKAEEKLLTAARLAPDSAEIQLELARLLAMSISDRRSEAVIAYEKARNLGAAPEPSLEKELGSMLNDRRDLVNFMSSAAREAEIGGDWNSAVWYYKKIVAEKHPGYIPLLAFAQWKSGNSSAAKETLEFNSPSRNAMVVRYLIAASENDGEISMRAAQQSVGADIPENWVGINLELEKIRNRRSKSAAEKILLKSLQLERKKTSQ